MGPVCTAHNVTVPCESRGWSIGGQALYLQPSSGIVGSDVFSKVPNSSELGVGLNPQWSWGFQLEADYRFSTGNDFNVNWYHYRNSDSSQLANPVSFTNVLFNSPISGQPTTYYNFTANSAGNSFSLAWDQVNMEFGKHFDLGQTDYARLHGGLNFSRVAGSNAINFNGSTQSLSNSSPTTYNTSKTLDTSFNGLGARVGLDLTHELMSGLDIYADGAFSLLAGSNKSSLYNYYSQNNIQYTSFVNSSRNRVVPELDARIGASYGYALAQGNINLNAGWLWANYFNVFTSNEKSFNVQGVYFGLKWDGDLA